MKLNVEQLEKAALMMGQANFNNIVEYMIHRYKTAEVVETGLLIKAGYAEESKRYIQANEPVSLVDFISCWNLGMPIYVSWQSLPQPPESGEPC